MKAIIHLLGGVIATLCIAIFFTSTVIAELIGSQDAVTTVKGLIVMPGLFILIPAIVATGGTGFALGKFRKGRLLEAKKVRMPLIAANGVLVLLPAAIFLDQWASAGTFDAKFYVVQSLELAAGAANLTLMGMNIRDGLNMTGRMRPNTQHSRSSRVQ